MTLSLFQMSGTKVLFALASEVRNFTRYLEFLLSYSGILLSFQGLTVGVAYCPLVLKAKDQPICN